MVNKIKSKKIVCLGGGIGTVNLVKGLRLYTEDINIVVSGADDGGSSGRLRKLYGIFPPGDAISCLSALSDNEDLREFLTYRFKGDRYSNINKLDGHKLGNLMFVSAYNQTKDTQKAFDQIAKYFGIKGRVLPATSEPTSLTAETVEGKKINSEEKIDLGLYKGKRVLDRVWVLPKDPMVPSQTVKAINVADVVILGPGDLYTTLLPVATIPAIREALIKSKAKKFFVVNVANKPFETSGYAVSDFLDAIKKHLEVFPFDYVVVNNNYKNKIPVNLRYKYVESGKVNKSSATFLVTDLVDKKFPLYHDSVKLAKLINKHI